MSVPIQAHQVPQEASPKRPTSVTGLQTRISDLTTDLKRDIHTVTATPKSESSTKKKDTAIHSAVHAHKEAIFESLSSSIGACINSSTKTLAFEDIKQAVTTHLDQLHLILGDSAKGHDPEKLAHAVSIEMTHHLEKLYKSSLAQGTKIVGDLVDVASGVVDFFPIVGPAAGLILDGVAGLTRLVSNILPPDLKITGKPKEHHEGLILGHSASELAVSAIKKGVTAATKMAPIAGQIISGVGLASDAILMVDGITKTISLSSSRSNLESIA